MFAHEGDDDEARTAMYERFASKAVYASSDFDDTEVGAEQIIRLDGVDGLLFVAEKLGERVLTDSDFWYDRYPLIVAEKQEGTEVVRQALERARTESPQVAAYLKVVEDVEADRTKGRSKRIDYAKLAYDELKPLIGRSEEELGIFTLQRWGQSADQESIQRAARDLVVENDPTRILHYLRIFKRRPFPLDPELLFAYAHSDDDSIARAALVALSKIRHPKVREVALQLLLTPKWAHMAVNLLERNYQAGDHALIERALMPEREANAYHWLGLGAFGVFETNFTSECAPVLLRLYENGPCSACRERLVGLLHEKELLPDWVIDECLHDANLDLREKARSLKR